MLACMPVGNLEKCGPSAEVAGWPCKWQCSCDTHQGRSLVILATGVGGGWVGGVIHLCRLKLLLSGGGNPLKEGMNYAPAQ